MEIKNTSTVEPNIFMLITGDSGAGKTTLAGTLTGKTIVVSVEAGLLSLAGKSIDFIEVTGKDDVEKWNNYLKAMAIAAKGNYDNIFVDSLSEVSDLILAAANKEFPDIKNTMQKWGYYTETLKRLIRSLRDIPKNVFVTSLLKTDKDEVGKRYYAPDVSGKMTDKMPAFFDTVLNIKVMSKDDKEIRVIQTFKDSGIICKDRSGKLDRYEKPDLSIILNKIKGGSINARNRDKAKDGKGDNKPDKNPAQQVSQGLQKA